MRQPISISHHKHGYRVQFFSRHPAATIPLDDERENAMLSRVHALKLSKRDYDAIAETPADAIMVAKNYLALDRQIDGTREPDWKVYPGFPRVY